MEEFKAEIDAIAARQGWTESTLAEVLIDFLSEQGPDVYEMCVRYLRERAAVENSE